MTSMVLPPAPKGLTAGEGSGWLPAWAAALSLPASIAPRCRVGALAVVVGARRLLPRLRRAAGVFAALIFWQLRPRPALVGIAGSLAVIRLYVYSRTNGS